MGEARCEHDTPCSHIISPLPHLLDESMCANCPTLSCPSLDACSCSQAAENTHRACRPGSPHPARDARSRTVGHILSTKENTRQQAITELVGHLVGMILLEIETDTYVLSTRLHYFISFI
jgi:hypothetical protein